MPQQAQTEGEPQHEAPPAEPQPSGTVRARLRRLLYGSSSPGFCEALGRGAQAADAAHPAPAFGRLQLEVGASEPDFAGPEAPTARTHTPPRAPSAQGSTEEDGRCRF